MFRFYLDDELDKVTFEEYFTTNLSEALDAHNCCVDEEDINTFFKLNWWEDEHSDLGEWSYEDYTVFAIDVAELGFWKACDEWDFNIPNEARIHLEDLD